MFNIGLKILLKDHLKLKMLSGGILLTNYQRSIHQVSVLKIKNKYKNSFVAIKGQCIKIERADKGRLWTNNLNWNGRPRKMMITTWKLGIDIEVINANIIDFFTNSNAKHLPGPKFSILFAILRVGKLNRL